MWCILQWAVLFGGLNVIEYFQQLLVTITNSLDKIDENQFNKLINESIATQKSGNKIIVTGLGKNVPICEKFVGTMLSMGLNATFMHTNTAIHGDLGTIHPGDLIIILSKSGETSESLLLLHYLKQRNNIVWGATFTENSSLSKKVDELLLLDIDHEGDQWDMVPNNSTTIYLIVLQALAIRISEVMKITLDDFKINHPGGHIGKVLRNE